MSRRNKKQSYLTRSDCLKIIEYSNDLLTFLSDSFRYQNCDNSIYYQRRYYNLKSLFQCFIYSLSDEES